MSGRIGSESETVLAWVRSDTCAGRSRGLPPDVESEVRGGGLLRRMVGGLVALALPIGLGAQTVVGVITDADSGNPISSAYAVVFTTQRDTLARALSDESGRFVLSPGPSEDDFLLRISALGYRDIVDGVFEIGRPDTLWATVRLSVAAIDIEGVVVPVVGRSAPLAERGFFERERTTTGQFMSREEIESGLRMSTLDVLERVSGLQVRYTAELQRGPPLVMTNYGTAIEARSAGRRCAPRIYLEGVPVQQGGEWSEPAELFDLRTINTDQILGIEVYDRPAGTPAIFSGASASCGVIVIWLR